MKKVLSIVLALAMVLCMIPALAADEHSFSAQKYHISVYQLNNAKQNSVNEKIALGTYPGGDYTKYQIGATSQKANSVTANFWYDKDDATQTGKWTEGKSMAMVHVEGFKFNDEDYKAKGDVTITIDGKELSVSENAAYKGYAGVFNDFVNFPLELIEGGYTKDMEIVATWKDKDGVSYTEKALVSVKLVDKAEAAKPEKTAYITNIAKNEDSNTVGALAGVKVVTYIVGNKIYADFEGDTPEKFAVDITFADENKNPFSCITYAYNDNDTYGVYLLPGELGATKFDGDAAASVKLKKSVGLFQVNTAKNAPAKDIVFKLETENTNYKVDKKYTLVCRTNIHEADPKGIYLEKSEATIAVGEEYVPVLKAVSNGAVLTPTAISIYDSFDKKVTDVIDWVGDAGSGKIIGTKPGVAYIKAWYIKDYDKGDFAYGSSSQKITVTLPGTSIPPMTEDYVVTCRNLNVRKGAGTSFGKTGMVHRGNVLKVVEIKDGWAKLADGTYVCAKYITK